MRKYHREIKNEDFKETFVKQEEETLDNYPLSIKEEPYEDEAPNIMNVKVEITEEEEETHDNDSFPVKEEPAQIDNSYDTDEETNDISENQNIEYHPQSVEEKSADIDD